MGEDAAFAGRIASLWNKAVQVTLHSSVYTP